MIGSAGVAAAVASHVRHDPVLARQDAVHKAKQRVDLLLRLTVAKFDARGLGVLDEAGVAGLLRHAGGEEPRREEVAWVLKGRPGNVLRPHDIQLVLLAFRALRRMVRTVPNTNANNNSSSSSTNSTDSNADSGVPHEPRTVNVRQHVVAMLREGKHAQSKTVVGAVVGLFGKGRCEGLEQAHNLRFVTQRSSCTSFRSTLSRTRLLRRAKPAKAKTKPKPNAGAVQCGADTNHDQRSRSDLVLVCPNARAHPL